MTHWQRIFSVTVSFAFAATIYFKIGMGTSQAVSHGSFGIAFNIGFAGAVLACISLNVIRVSAWSAVCGSLLGFCILLWLLLIAMISALPGNENIGSELINFVVLWPVIPIFILAVRLPQSIQLLAISTLGWLIVLVVGVQIVMRNAIAAEIKLFETKGGCVLSEKDNNKRIKNLGDIHLHWFIGPSSERFAFVEGERYYFWSYSEMGLSSRHGVPNFLPRTKDMMCN